MKLKHQIAAVTALLLLVAGCSQDQGMGGGKDSSSSVNADAQQPPKTETPAQPTDKQANPPNQATTNSPPASTPAPGDHQ